MDRLSVTVTAPAPGADSAPNQASAPPEDDTPSFGDFLRALNPLQHLPVIGTIYRAITGDTLAEPFRVLGSLVMGGLTGGVFGVLISAASNAVQSVLDISPDKIAHDVLAGIGLDDDTPDPAPASLESVALPSGAVPSGLTARDASAPDATRAATHAKAVAAYEHIFSLVQSSA